MTRSSRIYRAVVWYVLTVIMIQPLAVAVGHLGGMPNGTVGLEHHDHDSAMVSKDHAVDHAPAAAEQTPIGDHCPSNGDCHAGSCCYLAIDDYILFVSSPSGQGIEELSKPYRSISPLLPLHPPITSI